VTYKRRPLTLRAETDCSAQGWCLLRHNLISCHRPRHNRR